MRMGGIDMKIAMMTNNYKPFIGGVPISVERLSQSLRKRGHEVCIFAPEYEDEYWEEDVIRYRSCEKRMKNGMAIPNILDARINQEFRWRQFDLIHVHQPMLIGNVAVHLSRKYKSICIILNFFRKKAVRRRSRAISSGRERRCCPIIWPTT